MSAVIAPFLAADVPVLLWGAPGIGKTALLIALAKQQNAHMEVLIGSTLDPTDVGGWLIPTADSVVCAPPPWARRLRAALDRKQPAWLLLDELSCAPASVQAALLRVVHERQVGELNLRGVRVVAAANPGDLAADGGSLSAASANRWAHVDIGVNVAAWAQGELTGWGKGLPNATAAASAASVTSFLTRSSTLLLAVPPTADQQGRAWPSPRSWSAAIAALTALGGPKAEGARSVVAACVGAGAAAEWANWVIAQDLPDPEALLHGKAAWPERGDQIMVAASSVVAHALATNQRDLAWDVLDKQRPDAIVVAARTLFAGADTRNLPESAYRLVHTINNAGSR